MPFHLTNQLTTFLLTIAILLSSCWAFAQDYRPTAVEGANWVMLDLTHVVNQDWNGVVQRIEGDSIIDGIAYKKLYQAEFIIGPDDLQRELVPPFAMGRSTTLIALLRDEVDSRKVYGRIYDVATDNWTTDTLIHDFSLTVGDTLKGYFFEERPVGSVIIDTIRQTIDGVSYLAQVTESTVFVPGIGNVGLGPLSGAFYPETLLEYNTVILHCIGSLLDCGIEQLPPLPSYQPTAIEGANWIIVNSETSYYPYLAFVSYIQGDTIIEGVAYKKLYQRVVDYVDEQFGPPLEPPYSLLPGKELVAVLRDGADARRVYGRTVYLDQGATEVSADILMHDYSLGIGDTLKGLNFADEASPLVVEETGTEFYEGEVRRYQQASGLRFYEGIGSLEFGPTSGGYDLIFNCCLFYLVDYCAGDFPSCSIISSTVLLTDQLSITSFPNPFSGVINVAFSGSLPVPVSATLRDVNGRVLRREKLRGATRLETSDLSPGIYFLIYTDGQNTKTVKLIKN